MSTSKQIQDMIYSGYKPGRPRKLKYKFPRLDDAIKSKGTMKQFMERTGIHSCTYYNMQAGRAETTMGTINTLLDYTGLTYEEAFRSK